MKYIIQNYKIEAFDILLNEDCILSRYYPLINKKERIINECIRRNVLTKSDCESLDEHQLELIGLKTDDEKSYLKTFYIFMIILMIKLKKSIN